MEACVFRHQFVEAEGWVRKGIELFETHSDFENATYRGKAYIELATCLDRRNDLDDAVEAARSALKFYKSSPNIHSNGEPVCEV